MTTSTTDENLCVLPSIRLNRFRTDVLEITGDRSRAAQIMAAVEEHLERGSYRWGNACPQEGCGLRLTYYTEGGPVCPTHGHLGHTAPTELLIAYRPCTSEGDV